MATTILTRPTFQVRLLDPSEHAQLAQLPGFDQLNGTLPRQDHMQVLVAEALGAEDQPTGEILGFWALVLVPHAEPLWVAPNARRTSGLAGNVTLALLDGMQALMSAQDMTQGAVFTIDVGATPQMPALVEKLGCRRLGDAWVLPAALPPLGAPVEAGPTH